VFEAKAMGVLIALHLLGMEHHSDAATIRHDNQAVRATLTINKPKPAQCIIDGIFLQAEEICKQPVWPSYRVELMWAIVALRATRGLIRKPIRSGTQEGASLPPLLIESPGWMRQDDDGSW